MPLTRVPGSALCPRRRSSSIGRHRRCRMSYASRTPRRLCCKRRGAAARTRQLSALPRSFPVSGLRLSPSDIQNRNHRVAAPLSWRRVAIYPLVEVHLLFSSAGYRQRSPSVGHRRRPSTLCAFRNQRRLSCTRLDEGSLTNRLPAGTGSFPCSEFAPSPPDTQGRQRHVAAPY